jgi:enoyl-CoA hydratase/carnithine racemase
MSLASNVDPATGLSCRVHEGVASVRIARPPGNRFSWALIGALLALARRLRADRAVRVLVLEADGRDFSQGADLKDPALAAHVMGPSPAREELAAVGQSLVETWMTLPFVTVACARGWVVGAGACLLSASDFRFVTPETTLRFPEVELGMSLSWGILPRLTHAYSLPWTKRLVLAGEAVQARSLPPGAFMIHPDDALNDATATFAADIAAKSPLAIRHTLETLQALEATDQPAVRADASRFALTAGSAEFRRRALARLQGSKA